MRNGDAWSGAAAEATGAAEAGTAEDAAVPVGSVSPVGSADFAVDAAVSDMAGTITPARWAPPGPAPTPGRACGRAPGPGIGRAVGTAGRVVGPVEPWAVLIIQFGSFGLVAGNFWNYLDARLIVSLRKIYLGPFGASSFPVPATYVLDDPKDW
ncbi:hypothetical protein FRACA_100049 [Frankia canadensis]|uniref:Uncharacterized protein n=1 Tax=Frankia canadensis TaxID=1836972 RepID=A0A2I2KIJ0_9ACTN|nr:hypothetical protein FRACA_100049 [Frankia canadensis]SOU52771.1 hypothetical protein FRACA_100049 [Frankia canadensis]